MSDQTRYDRIKPLPLSASPKRYLRLVRDGARGRAALISERYQPSGAFVPRHLTVLYGMALLDAPALEPEPAAVEEALTTVDQAALDAVDRLYRPLDRAALLLTHVPHETHIDRLKAYATQVAASPRLIEDSLHSGAPDSVRALLEKPFRYTSLETTRGPLEVTASLLRLVLHHTDPDIPHQAIWRGPDGTHYEIAGWTMVQGTYALQPVAQDVDTRQWSVAPGEGVSVEETVLLRDYTSMVREPFADPRITHLGTLVRALLVTHEEATGRPPEKAEEIRTALAAVEEIPEEARRRYHGGRMAAARHAYQRGRRR
ncbi:MULTISPECIES: hypothetical protein [unclassified Streptomyces]|uniref:hypothetical protein n=1 Tax=unclassified Streptomyces TaxID=2593676 RepID=UPI0035DE77E3